MLWKPEPGDELHGQVMNIGWRRGKFGPYQLWTIRTADGERWAVLGFHVSLVEQLQQVDVGEEIRVHYLGRASGSHEYVVTGRHDGEIEAAVDMRIAA